MSIDTEVQFAEQRQVAAESRGAIAQRWKRFWLRSRDTVQGYLFLSPYLLFYVVFLVVPTFYGAWISLHRWDVVGTTKAFIGLANFQRIFSDKLFWTSLRHTLFFLMLATPMRILIGLLLALALNRARRGLSIYRTVFYLPSVLSVSVVGLVWVNLYDSRYGLIAHLLRFLGISPISWLMDPKLAMPAITITSLWWGVGFPMLVFLAGLQDIPEILYEAAKLDGAGSWALFRHITLPGLRRPFSFVLVMQILGAFQIFGLVYVMTGGGPAGHTRTLVMQIYETSFIYWQLGYGSALSYALFAVIFGVSLMQLRLFASLEE